MAREDRWTWRMPALAAALAALAGCQGAQQPPAASSSAGCLYGTAVEIEACEDYDEEPEQCRIAGGIYDAATQRCIR